MNEPRKTRKKNIGFKAQGVDPAHDVVFAVLDSLPRGGASDIIVRSVMEFLKNHAGETIAGTGKRQYIILGDYPSYELPDVKSKTKGTKAIHLQAEPHESEPETTQIEESPPEQESFTELDEDTLAGLVLGFFPE